MIKFNSEGGFTETKEPKKNKYQILKAAGKLHGTIKDALAKRAKRDELNYTPTLVTFNRFAGLAKVRAIRRSCPVLVPLGQYDALSRVKDDNRRLKEWSLGQRAAHLNVAWRMREIGSNSDWNKRSTFQRGIEVQSFATCANFRVAVLHLEGKVYEIKAPRGWRWDSDTNGLKLRSCSNSRIDYHPTASELIGNVAELPTKAKANYKTRQDAARKAKADAKAAAEKAAKDAEAVRRAEEVGVMVCLADSVRAGNCRAGSESFARNHGLDPAKHYSPSEVLAIANGQTRFVALACTAALRRTIKELAQGYSELADHRVN